MRDDEDPAAPKPEATGVKPLRTLLYVEDNPANLLLVEQLIARRPDMQLLSAINGTLGIELARVAPAAGDPDGYQPARHQRYHSLEKLREDPATAHIPVVALSANAMPHDLAKGLEVGFFRLSHQTDQDSRLHGHAQRGAGVCRETTNRRTTTVISGADILKASILIVDDQVGRRCSS